MCVCIYKFAYTYTLRDENEEKLDVERGKQ